MLLRYVFSANQQCRVCGEKNKSYVSSRDTENFDKIDFLAISPRIFTSKLNMHNDVKNMQLQIMKSGFTKMVDIHFYRLPSCFP